MSRGIELSVLSVLSYRLTSWTLLKVWDSVFLISISSFCIRRPLTSEHDTRNSRESCWTQQERLSLHSCSLTWTHADITQHSNSRHTAAGEAGGNKRKERKTVCLWVSSCTRHNFITAKSEKGFRFSLCSVFVQLWHFPTGTGKFTDSLINNTVCHSGGI